MRFRRLCGEVFVGFPGVLLWPTAGEAPDVRIERAEFFLNFEKGARVANSGIDFQPVANDSGIAEQFADFLFVDRKSTRLNSSHQIISYAVFCLKKKTY